MKNKTYTLQNYTFRYLVIALLIVVAVWAGLFYAVILDEVYDNIDDGLKNSKILIEREAYANPKLLNTPEFGINQFKIEPLPPGSYNLQDRLSSTMEFSEYDNEDQPIRLLDHVFKDVNGTYHRLTIRASIVEEDELLQDLLTALVVLYIMLVVSIAAINRYILNKAWRPFYSLLGSLKKYKLGGSHNFKASQSDIAEFTTLGHELENLAERNETVFNSQKQFIENASHELQTPLAISLNKLELFAESHPLNEKQLAEIGKISETLQRLVRTNKSLLMLSKIENNQFAAHDTVDFNRLVQQLKDDFEDLAAYKNIEITIIDNAPLLFDMNKGLAASLLSNLIKNAVIHNQAGGFVTITIAINTISIKNSGNTTPLDDKAIYNRFHRSTLHEQSTGLGLSIVKSVVVNYNIGLSYTYSKGHMFTLTFPQ